MQRERDILFQCIKYIVANDFFDSYESESDEEESDEDEEESDEDEEEEESEENEEEDGNDTEDKAKDNPQAESTAGGSTGQDVTGEQSNSVAVG